MYHNLDNDEDLALACDEEVRYAKKSDWKGNPQKENEIKKALSTSVIFPSLSALKLSVKKTTCSF